MCHKATNLIRLDGLSQGSVTERPGQDGLPPLECGRAAHQVWPCHSTHDFRGYGSKHAALEDRG
mgnify:CR=1 FL=1